MSARHLANLIRINQEEIQSGLVNQTFDVAENFVSAAGQTGMLAYQTGGGIVLAIVLARLKYHVDAWGYKSPPVATALPILDIPGPAVLPIGRSVCPQTYGNI